MKKGRRFCYLGISLLFLIVLICSIASAHEETQEKSFTKAELTKFSLIFIAFAAINAALFLLITSSGYVRSKLCLFLAIIIPIIFASLFLIGSTVYTNMLSHTKGPVHWHADIEIWACGEQLDIIDPVGLSNRVGTSTFHEHNDNRIHVEGVVEDISDASLHRFFEFIGGEINSSGLTLLANDGSVQYNNGEQCNGTLQVFVYKTEGETVSQKKIENFEEYILSPYSQVPPGDCIIIEFSEEKNTTERICETYRIALEKGDVHGS